MTTLHVYNGIYYAWEKKTCTSQWGTCNFISWGV